MAARLVVLLIYFTVVNRWSKVFSFIEPRACEVDSVPSTKKFVVVKDEPSAHKNPTASAGTVIVSGLVPPAFVTKRLIRLTVTRLTH